MKKTICRALLCLLLAACLLPLTARTAHADKIYDEIVNYQVDVTPNTEDGSLAIQVTLDWKPLEDLPATNSQQGGAKIGIPNGSIREMTALTDNIQSIDHDNSLAYIDFTQSYDANETFRFAFRWVQEYMYTLSDSGAVSYDYTPGWFKEAPVDVMTLTWHDPASVAGVGSDGQTGGDHVLTASNMEPGDRLNFTVEYASWPSTLYWENSRDNLPDNSRGDDSYDDSDDSVLPRSIATKKAFENAMTMDVAMGGSTNTVLHILAMAQSADVDFTLDDIERISHTVPCICKASPSGEWEISDVHRAGGITGILGELDRAGKLHRDVHSIDYKSLEDKLNDWDIMRDTCTEEAKQMYLAAPGHIVSPEPWTHTTLFDSLDRDRVNGAIHDIDHPAVTEGGLAVLRGNLAPDGCVVKTAGVPKEIWTFRGPALVVESQEQAIEVILNDTLKPGMALVIRYEGPKGGPGMQEMLYPTSFVKGKGIGKQVAMLTDGRYSGGSSGLAIGHIAPEAANKGPIALIKNGDIINIDIPNRTVNVELSDEELTQRRAELEAGDGYVAHRDRKVSQALKAYAAFARSADKGATRDPELIDKLSGLA